MKVKLVLMAIALSLASCAAPSDPTFMANAAAAINGGVISTPEGAMLSPGLQNRNRPHPFFGVSQ